MKHISPYIEEAVEKCIMMVLQRVTVVLAPHYSSFSVGSYNKRAKEEADKYGIQLHHVERYYQQSKFIEYWTNKVNETLVKFQKKNMMKQF